jgi:arginine deiminase
MDKHQDFSVSVCSEIGKLEAVIIHTPGSEVENMTPQNAERALYSDILSLSVAHKEYFQFREVLKKTTHVYEVKELLREILKNEKVKNDLVSKVCSEAIDPQMKDQLTASDPLALADMLIEGVVMNRNSLTRFLNPQRFDIRPLHNFFFTRDAAISMFNRVLVGKMASKVRERESQIMEAIFDYYPDFKTKTFHSCAEVPKCEKASIEGGDVLIGRDNLILIGLGSRTTAAGVDGIIETLRQDRKQYDIIVQELPEKGESFIHLDMVFTFLNKYECMVYEPVVLQPNRFKTIHIQVEGESVKIVEEKNILETLNKIGFDVEPIHCGGRADPWTQEREQWHSGANIETYFIQCF